MTEKAIVTCSEVIGWYPRYIVTKMWKSLNILKVGLVTLPTAGREIVHSVYDDITSFDIYLGHLSSPLLISGL